MWLLLLLALGWDWLSDLPRPPPSRPSRLIGDPKRGPSHPARAPLGVVLTLALTALHLARRVHVNAHRRHIVAAPRISTRVVQASADAHLLRLPGDQPYAAASPIVRDARGECQAVARTPLPSVLQQLHQPKRIERGMAGAERLQVHPDCRDWRPIWLRTYDAWLLV